MVYASVSQGFTAGGFNTDASSLAAFNKTFAPEVLTSYEIGTKTSWFEDRFRANADVFKMDFHNEQELLFNSETHILDIVNAATATSKGIELELAYKPSQWVTLNTNFSRLWTRYDNFHIGTTNYTGNQMSDAPPFDGSVSASWHYPVSGIGRVFGAASFSYIDTYNTGAAADPALQIPSYGLVNANFGYEWHERRYRVTLWANNLTNKNYILTRSTQTIDAEYLGNRRMYGVTFTLDFH